MPGKYTGVHSFLFLYDDDDPETVIEQLKEIVDPENGPVFFAELFDGDFRGFAHLGEDSLEALGDLVDGELWSRGVRSDLDTEARFYTSSGAVKMGPKRGSPRYCAISRVKTTMRPIAVMQAIAQHFDEAPPFVGASVVIGRFKLVVELGADDRDTLDKALEELDGIEGVARGERGIADTGAMTG